MWSSKKAFITLFQILDEVFSPTKEGKHLSESPPENIPKIIEKDSEKEKESTNNGNEPSENDKTSSSESSKLPQKNKRKLIENIPVKKKKKVYL